MNDSIENIEKPKKFHIDDGTFWMIFAFALALIILYMAFDWRNAVEAMAKSLHASGCAEYCYNLSNILPLLP